MANDFINRITDIIVENISNEQFGVSELAGEAGMSRSNLLRKIKNTTGLSASQFIRKVRLEKAMEMLKDTSMNVSEVSFKVGFSSTSYFIKCFREQYGFPPGEAGKEEEASEDEKASTGEAYKHQLAAIMFTDIQGYTALMQKDEATALEFRNRHRNIFNSAIENHNGKILQYYGDGTLSTFQSAIDAVRCGIEMQLAFLEEPRMPVRIGIHTGDIIFTIDDIIGDGVNVASRIESLAIAGSIFVSEKVFDEIKNKPGIETVSVGEFEFKNIDRPIEVFAVANDGLEVPEKGQILNGKLKVKKEQGGGQAWLKDRAMTWIVVALAVIVVVYLFYNSELFKSQTSSVDPGISEKSIAVLPFINDSDDSTNIYIINGMMEAILNNLQKIKDLRVISRTSVEKYRNNPKSIPEIADELNVKYLLEGSGQKIGDQIRLSVQLIDGPSDKHIWAEQYNREIIDIFGLQSEIAESVAGEIKVVITPEEKQRIGKALTDDLIAYDYYLKGRDALQPGKRESLNVAIPWFVKAIEQDDEFGVAYAELAIAYYYMDLFKTEKLYIDSINYYSDRAILLDPDNPQCLKARAYYYMHGRQYDLALPYLEKAIEYNPNSSGVINALTDFYANYSPDLRKYLEYALKGTKLDVAGQDSVDYSYTLLHLGNALIQSGFVTEADYYISRSLDYNPANLYSEQVKAYIRFAQTGDLDQTRVILLEAFRKDTTRIDIIQEIGKVYFYQRDYENSFKYYRALVDIRDEFNLDLFIHENVKIAYVFDRMGLHEEAKELLGDFRVFAENDQSIYNDMSLALYYSYIGEQQKAIEHLRKFSEKEDYVYWIVLFLEMDPLLDNIKDSPEFAKIMKTIKDNFWSYHEDMRKTLEEQDLI